MRLAHALSEDFSVHLPDRRGRGSSGPHGDTFGIAREVVQLIPTQRFDMRLVASLLRPFFA